MVEAFLAEFNQARGENLDLRKANLPVPPTTDREHRAHAEHLDFECRYHDLAAGLFADAQLATSIGVAPTVLGVVVAGVVIGVAGIAWAVAAYEYAVNLREKSTLATREIEAREQPA